jgi:hypothetical protein
MVMPFPTSRKPKQESAKAKAAFAEYCALGEDRSLAKLAQKWGKSRAYVGQLERWSAAHSWQERVAQYDWARTEEKRRRHEREIEEMDSRHAKLGAALQTTMLAQVQRLLSSEDFTPSTVISGLKLGVDLERLALGAATERFEQTGKGGGPIQLARHPDLALATDEELDALEAIILHILQRQRATSELA